MTGAPDGPRAAAASAPSRVPAPSRLPVSSLPAPRASPDTWHPAAPAGEPAVLTLREHAPPVSLPVDAAAGRALAAARVLDTAVPDPYAEGRWRLKAGSLVGALRIPVAGQEPLTVRIRPKVPVQRLFFLLGHSLDPDGAWRDGRDGAVDVGAYDDVVPAIAHAVERQLERALRQGVLQDYTRVEEASPVVRGRIREAEQVRRRFGRTPPVEVAYDAYTPDIPENRVLRAAAETLLRLPGVPGAVRRRLAHHRTRLADAAPLQRGRPLPAWQPSRLNARYRPALRLAETVLRGASPEHRPGDLHVDGFLLDMNRLFEDFVTTALRRAVRGRGLEGRLQAPVRLDTAGAVRMAPDLVVYATDGRSPVAVADAKYKATTGAPHADLYQLLAYCTALGLTEGHLVYARGPHADPHPGGAVHEVRHAGVRLHRHVLDLDRPPDGLRQQVENLAELLTGSPPFV